MTVLRGNLWQYTAQLTVPPSSARMVVIPSGQHGYIVTLRAISDLTADDQLILQIYQRWPCYLDLGGQEDSCPPGGDTDDLFELLPPDGASGKAGVIDLNYSVADSGNTAEREVLVPYVNMDEDQARRNQIYVVFSNQHATSVQNIKIRVAGISGDARFQ